MKRLLAVLTGLAIAGLRRHRTRPAGSRIRIPGRDGERTVPAESLGLGSGTQLTIVPRRRDRAQEQPGGRHPAAPAWNAARPSWSRSMPAICPRSRSTPIIRWNKSGGGRQRRPQRVEGREKQRHHPVARRQRGCQHHDLRFRPHRCLAPPGLRPVLRGPCRPFLGRERRRLPASARPSTTCSSRKNWSASAKKTVRQFEKRLEQVKGFVEAGTRQKYDLTKAQGRPRERPADARSKPAPSSASPRPR